MGNNQIVIKDPERYQDSLDSIKDWYEQYKSGKVEAPEAINGILEKLRYLHIDFNLQIYTLTRIRKDLLGRKDPTWQMLRKREFVNEVETLTESLKRAVKFVKYVSYHGKRKDD